jgi:hypothetical protein
MEKENWRPNVEFQNWEEKTLVSALLLTAQNAA